MVQINPNACTVHGFPDKVEAEINDIFKLFLINGRYMMEGHLRLLQIIYL